MERFETAGKHWDAMMKEFVQQISEATIPSLLNV